MACWWAMPGFLQTWHLAFTKEFNLCVIRLENVASSGLRVLQVPFDKRPGCCYARLSSGHHTGLTGGLLKGLLSFWKILISQRNTGFLTDGFGHPLSFDAQPGLGRVLVIPNLFSLWIIEATELTEIFKAAELFIYIFFVLLTTGPFIDVCLTFQVHLNQWFTITVNVTQVKCGEFFQDVLQCELL